MVAAVLAPDIVQDLESWYALHGGAASQVHVAHISEKEGSGLVTTEAVRKGQQVIQVPLEISMCVETVERSVMKDVLGGEPYLRDMEDELLALILMAERRRAADSFWYPYLRSIPEDYDTPLYWSEDERRHLEGTNVGILTKMMENQVEKDWSDLHQGLVEKYPAVLSGVTIRDYTWALSTIWSRAVGLTKCGRYMRCLAPVLDMCNHHPLSAPHLDELLSYDDKSNSLVLIAHADLQPGQQCFIPYGQYTNAKLLYSYGFVSRETPYRGLDFWTRVPSTAKDAEWKTQQLREHQLTAHQNYDFTGTIKGDDVSIALMATIRLIQLAQEDYAEVDKIFEGRMINKRNELAALRSLIESLEGKLKSYGSSIDEDTATLTKLERCLDDLTSKGQQGDAAGLRKTMWRRVCALTVLVDDKTVIRDTVATVSKWKARLEEVPEDVMVPATANGTAAGGEDGVQ